MTDASEITASEDPPVLDTYSTVFAFVLVFLLPAVALLSRLPFGDARSSTYTFSYVSLVMVPFVLGLAATLLTDSRDGIRRVLVRFAVLTPLVAATSVGVMFGTSMVMIPASKLLGIREQGLSAVFWLSMAVVLLPLPVALWRRLRIRPTAASVAQAAALIVAVALAAGIAYFTLVMGGTFETFVRKDVVIYIMGAITWYLPSFGISAGVWRRLGLV